MSAMLMCRLQARRACRKHGSSLAGTRAAAASAAAAAAEQQETTAERRAHECATRRAARCSAESCLSRASLIPFFSLKTAVLVPPGQNFRACGAAEMGGALRACRQIGTPPSASTPVTVTARSTPRGNVGAVPLFCHVLMSLSYASDRVSHSITTGCW